MASFWQELKRRKVVRVAIAYVVASWLLIQVADVIINNIGAPAWVFQTILLVLAIGFPVAVILAWAFDFSPQGLKKETAEVPRMQTISVVAIGLAALVFAGAMFWLQMGERNSPADNFADVRLSNPVLAVLPFTNMSSSSENEFVADGMTEDIITLLAQSPGVEVIARNSTFKYKGQNPDIRVVGQDLGADYVVEGSIRPLQDRIRVTVQVIETDTGSHVWAEKYDRPLSDFFAVQDEVSLGIAAAVGDAVFREEFSAAKQSRSDNRTAWVLTSRAEMIFNLNDVPDAREGIDLAREAISLDPDYALAHAVLGRQLALTSLVFGWPNREALLPGATAYRAEAEAEARLAARLAPDDPKVLSFVAIALLWTNHAEEALSIAERVTKISPSYAEGLAYYADILIHNGRSLDSIPYFDTAIRLTPNAPQLGFYNFLRGEALMHHGDFTAAEVSLIKANQIYQGKHVGVLQYLAGTQLRLGKINIAKSTKEKATTPYGLSIDDAQQILEFYSTDRGGDYFKSLWGDLQRL
jgi:TolB-like protein